MSLIHIHTYPNGLVLIVQSMEGVATAGLSLLLPAGAIQQPRGREGVGTVLSRMILRGAGELDARGFREALEELGVHIEADLESRHLRISAAMLGASLPKALPLLAQGVRGPHLADGDLAPCVDLALSALESLEDEPQQRVLVELRRLHLGEPAGRNALGVAGDLQGLKIADVRGFHQRHFVPTGAILALAGAVEFNELREQVGALLGQWSGNPAPEVSFSYPEAGGRGHIQEDSAQVHIGLAMRTVAEAHSESMIQRLAVAALSGSMSSRLWRAVREEQALAYSVWGAYLAQKDIGTLFVYAGTTAQGVGRTMEILQRELDRLKQGITEDELNRARVGLKSRLVMQGQSAPARAAALADEWYLRSGVRSLEEIIAAVEGVTLPQINDFLARSSSEPWTHLSIGPEAPAPGVST